MNNSTGLSDGVNSTQIGVAMETIVDATKDILENTIKNLAHELRAKNPEHIDHELNMHHMHHQHLGMGQRMPMMHDAMMVHDSVSVGQHHMMMWFHGGYDEVILFDFWRINSFCGLLISCLLIFMMSASYEGIKWFRVCLQMSSEKASSQNSNLKQIESRKGLLEEANQNGVVYKPTTTVTNNNTSPRVCYRGLQSPFAFRHIIQGILYAVQLTLAYWMMLVAMTYNSYLTAAVIIGAAFGHWLFAVLKCLNPQADHLDSLATDACH